MIQRLAKSELLNKKMGVRIRNFFDPISNQNEYKEVGGRLNLKSVESVLVEDWDKDVEFSDHSANGMNPLRIHGIKKIPKKIVRDTTDRRY